MRMVEAARALAAGTANALDDGLEERRGVEQAGVEVPQERRIHRPGRGFHLGVRERGQQASKQGLVDRAAVHERPEIDAAQTTDERVPLVKELQRAAKIGEAEDT